MNLELGRRIRVQLHIHAHICMVVQHIAFGRYGYRHKMVYMVTFLLQIH